MKSQHFYKHIVLYWLNSQVFQFSQIFENLFVRRFNSVVLQPSE